MHNKIIEATILPSDEDEKLIRTIIDEYEEQFPGKIAKAVRQQRRNESYQVGGKKNVDPYLNKGKNLRKIADIPEDLGIKLTAYAPHVFRSKEGFHWFMKKFPQFQVPDKVDF